MGCPNGGPFPFLRVPSRDFPQLRRSFLRRPLTALPPFPLRRSLPLLSFLPLKAHSAANQSGAGNAFGQNAVFTVSTKAVYNGDNDKKEQ